MPVQRLPFHRVYCVQAPVRNWAWHPDAYFRTPAIMAGQCEEQQLWDLPQSFFTNGWRDLRCSRSLHRHLQVPPSNPPFLVKLHTRCFELLLVLLPM